MRPEKRTCEECGKPILGRSDKKFCSNSCKALSWEKQKRGGVFKTTVTSETSGKRLETTETSSLSQETSSLSQETSSLSQETSPVIVKTIVEEKLAQCEGCQRWYPWSELKMCYDYALSMRLRECHSCEIGKSRVQGIYNPKPAS